MVSNHLNRCDIRNRSGGTCAGGGAGACGPPHNRCFVPFWRLRRQNGTKQRDFRRGNAPPDHPPERLRDIQPSLSKPSFPWHTWLFASVISSVLMNSAVSPFAPAILLFVPALSSIAMVLAQWLVLRRFITRPVVGLLILVIAVIVSWMLGAVVSIGGSTLLHTLNLLAVGSSVPAALLRGATFGALAGSVVGLFLGYAQAVVVGMPPCYRTRWFLISSSIWAGSTAIYGIAIAVWAVGGIGLHTVIAWIGGVAFGDHSSHWVSFLGLLGAVSGSMIGICPWIIPTWLHDPQQHSTEKDKADA